MTAPPDGVGDAIADTGTPRFDAVLVRSRRNGLVLGLGLSPLALVLVAPFVAGPLVIVTAVLFTFLWNKNVAARRFRVHVRADACGVEVGQELVHRTTIQHGFVLPSLGKAWVVLHRKGVRTNITLGVEDVAQGRGLLTALGLDAAQTVVRLRARSLALASTWFYFALVAMGPLFLFGVGGHHGRGSAVYAFAPIAALLLGLAAAVIPSRLTIGADGLEVRWLGRRRFVRYAEILAVTRFTAGFGNWRSAGVEVAVEGGPPLRIPVASRSGGDQRILVILERIRESMEAFDKTGGDEATSELLARGPREVATWVRALRGLGAGANASMRTAPVARDRLWRIVEDPTGDAASRAAAAVAIGGDLDDAARDRLRAAADAVAAPDLRAALEAAAGEDDAAMGEALEALDASSARRKGHAT